MGMAALSGHESAVRILLDANAKIEQYCIFQNSEPTGRSGLGGPLFVAAALGNEAVVQTLLAARADAQGRGACSDDNVDNCGRFYFCSGDKITCKDVDSSVSSDSETEINSSYCFSMAVA